MTGRWTGWLLCAALAAPLPVAGQAANERAEAERAIEAARVGGTILVCRHARTDSFREREPVDYDDPATQRRLSPEGEEQSRALARALAARGVRITDVVASPMDRAVRTARLMAGPPRIDPIWHTNDGKYEGPGRDRRLEALTGPVPDGNRLVVSHITTMKSVIPEVEGRVAEGDCAVVRPHPDGHRFVGVVPWRAWSRPAP